MKSIKCLGHAVLYYFAAVGFGTYRTEGHSDVVRCVTAAGMGICFGLAFGMCLCSVVYFMIPNLGEEKQEKQEC